MFRGGGNRVKALVWLVFVLHAFSAIVLAEPPVPEAFARPLSMDQLNNVTDRWIRNDYLTPAVTETVPLYHYEVPVKDLRTFNSEFLDEATKSQVMFTRKDGVACVRLFVLNKVKGLRYPLKQEYWAKRTQSHSSYFAWNPAQPGSELYVKLRLVEGDEIYNDADSVRLAVHNNDAVEKILTEHGDGFISLLPERFGASLKKGKIDYAISVRAATPTSGPSLESSDLFPLHGFVGSPRHIYSRWIASDELRAAAKLRGLTPEEWLKEEYLPKLARLFATLHTKLGLHPTAHTQNLLIRINKTTGEIDGFVLRDMHDMMFDPFIRVARGLNPHAESLARQGTSRAYEYFVERSEKMRDLHQHFGSYSGQSVLGLTSHGEEQPLWTREFLKFYAKETEKILGEKIEFSQRAQEGLSRLTFPGHYSNSWEVADELTNIAEEIFGRVREKLMPRFSHGMTGFDQSLLKEIFGKKDQRWEVALAKPYSRDHLAQYYDEKREVWFGYEGKGILAYEGTPERPMLIGYAFGLSHLDRRRIRKTATPEASRYLCGGDYGEIGSSGLPSRGSSSEPSAPL